MNRKALKLPFSQSSAPEWQCPTCKSGRLSIKKDSFHKEERCHSRDHSHAAWEPEWIEYLFSCLLTCANEHCKEVVACTGTGSVDSYVFEDKNGDCDQGYDDFFRPKYFEPHLELLSIPDKCRDAVAAPLRESFRVFFAAPSAASNSVRVAIEELLTDLKVRRFNVVKGQRRFISLHQRISLLPSKYAHLKDLALAIKWLGNAGSHGSGDGKGSITIDDVMDSYELTEHILQEVYAPKVKKLLALAKKVNKKKGPAK